MAKGRRTPNDNKVDAALRGDLRRFDAPRPIPLVPGINGFPLMPSVTPRKPTMKGEKRAKACRTGKLAEGFGYTATYRTSRGDTFDKHTKMPVGYVKPAEQHRAEDFDRAERDEARQRAMLRQWEAHEKQRVLAERKAQAAKRKEEREAREHHLWQAELGILD